MTHHTATAVAVPIETDELEATLASWRRHLRAAGRSPATVKSYTDGLTQFRKYLIHEGMPRDPRHITREHIESWLVDLQETREKSTVATRHQILVQFFKYLVDEDEIRRSPMERIQRPTFNPKPIPVITDEEFEDLLDACVGRTYDCIRDKTILMTLMDTGIRRAEAGAIRLADLDIEKQVIRITGKGDKDRLVSYSVYLATQLDRYLTARRRYLADHRRMDGDELWIGAGNKPFGHHGVEYTVRRRATLAGLVDDLGSPTIHTHMFRHTCAHRLLESGMDPAAVMAQMGWKDPAMLTRYGVSMAHARAAKHYERFSPLAKRRD